MVLKSRILVVSEIFHNTAQVAEFMFQNVAYRATVYRTGPLGIIRCPGEERA